MTKEGLLHHGIELGFSRKRFRIDMEALTGKAVMVYAQHEVVKDLIKARLAAVAPIVFEAQDVAISGIEGNKPLVHLCERWRRAGD